MAQYWYLFLVPGVLLGITAAVVQLLNIKNLLVGGADIAKKFGSDAEAPEFQSAVGNVGKKVGRGFFLVVVLGGVGSVLTIIGLITLVVHLLK